MTKNMSVDFDYMKTTRKKEDSVKWPGMESGLVFEVLLGGSTVFPMSISRGHTRIEH